MDFWQSKWDRTGEAVASEVERFAEDECVRPVEMARRLLLGEAER